MPSSIKWQKDMSSVRLELTTFRWPKLMFRSYRFQYETDALANCATKTWLLRVMPLIIQTRKIAQQLTT
ncbi:hypothetical protein V8C42DRAFT_308238 [Trichoderma barbatum]